MSLLATGKVKKGRKFFVVLLMDPRHCQFYLTFCNLAGKATKQANQTGNDQVFKAIQNRSSTQLQTIAPINQADTLLNKTNHGALTSNGIGNL
jgi:hypothetical protein